MMNSNIIKECKYIQLLSDLKDLKVKTFMVKDRIILRLELD